MYTHMLHIESLRHVTRYELEQPNLIPHKLISHD